MIKLFTLLFLSLFFLTGCITPWALSNGSTINNKSRYGLTVTTPKGWYTKKINETRVFTKRGLSLEYIMLDARKWKDSLSNGYTIPHNVLLHEIPEIVLGELCANSVALNMIIDSNKIIKIDGLPCSVTDFYYVSDKNLQMKGIQYCIPFKKTITVIRYTAEKSNYFDKGHKDFIDMIHTIDIKNKKYRSLPGISLQAE